MVEGSTAGKSWYMEDFFYFFSWSCHRKDYQVLEHTAERGGRVTISGHVKKKKLGYGSWFSAKHSGGARLSVVLGDLRSLLQP